MKENPGPDGTPSAYARGSGSRIRPVLSRRSRLGRARRAVLQCWHTLRFVRDGLRGLKGLPLIGSLRMLSLGFLPDRQVTYGLGPWPSRRQAKLFLPDLQRTRIWLSAAARWRSTSLLGDKVRFAELVGSFASTPKLLAVIQSGRVFPTSADLPTADADGLVAAARVHDGLVLKPRRGGGGDGVFLLAPVGEQLRLDRELVQPAGLAELIRRLDSYIVTPRVRQARYAAALFSRTTNVVRVLTMVDPANGEAFVAMAGQKIGTEASFPVDNPARGGLYSIIDLESGRLTVAVTEDGSRYDRHPDSGAQIAGVTIPRWRELLDSIKRLAQQLDFIDYIGWDLVVTEEGFCVIEGNRNPDFLPVPMLADARVRAFYQHYTSLGDDRASEEDRHRMTESGDKRSQPNGEPPEGGDHAKRDRAGNATDSGPAPEARY